MVTAVFKPGMSAVIAYGLCQYDRGKILEITGLSLPDLVEIHMALLDDGKDAAYICLGETRNGKTTVKIPDSLLRSGDDIAAYIYPSKEETKETVRSVFLPVQTREKPELDIPEDESDMLRILLERINKKADNVKITDGFLQLLSGETLVGDRVRLPTGASGGGREIELKNDGNAICWRYTDSNEWNTLVSMEELKGKDGETPEFEIRDGHLFAVYQN